VFVVISIVLALGGWLLARARYRDRTAALAWEPRVPGHRIIEGKYFVDELYARTVVAAFMQVRVFLGQFDRWVVDGLVNAAGMGLRAAAWIGGKIDELVVDGLVNWLSEATLRFGRGLRTLQDGRIQRYVYGVITGALLLAVAAYFSPQLLVLPRLLSRYLQVDP
jgi:hypothetical protein